MDDDPEAAPDDYVADEVEGDPDPFASKRSAREGGGGEQGNGGVGDGEDHHGVGVEGGFGGSFRAFDEEDLPTAEDEVEQEAAEEQLAGGE